MLHWKTGDNSGVIDFNDGPYGVFHGKVLTGYVYESKSARRGSTETKKYSRK